MARSTFYQVTIEMTLSDECVHLNCANLHNRMATVYHTAPFSYIIL